MSRPLDDEQDALEFDPLDPKAVTRVSGGQALTEVAAVDRSASTAVVSREASTKVVSREASTKVVERPAAPAAPPAQPKLPPLKIDFAEVLGRSREGAGARRIGAEALDMGEFQSKYQKEALERAAAAPKFDMSSSLDGELRGQAVRVVERKGRVWLWALVAILVPALLSVGATFLYYRMHTKDAAKELEALKKADEIHRRAAEEHEKEMAR